MRSGSTNGDGVGAASATAGCTLSYRLLLDQADLEAAAAVIGAVWGDPTVSSPSLLRAYTHFGNPTLGAFTDGELVGVSVGFLAPSGGVHLHSHITGVLGPFQHLGIGYGLKLAQRDWCLAHGIDEVTWTFDPMVARNAHFNLRKLGAIAEAVLPEFYGDMDDAMNKGDATDRLETHWYLGADGRRAPMSGPGADAHPEAAIVRTVAIPRDYYGLRAHDPVVARRERLRVREELVAAFDAGLHIVDFTERCEYALAAPS